MTRLRHLLAALAAAAVLPAGAAAADGYVPFVTDFPQQEERYVPFVTDFPRPAAPAGAPDPAPAGIDLGAPVEAVGAAVAAALAAGAALALARRRRSELRLGDC